MPVYDYECQNCEYELHVTQKITEPLKRKCPRCKKLRLKKLISPSSFVLKGKGWAKDGYS